MLQRIFGHVYTSNEGLHYLVLKMVPFGFWLIDSLFLSHLFIISFLLSSANLLCSYKTLSMP